MRKAPDNHRWLIGALLTHYYLLLHPLIRLLHFYISLNDSTSTICLKAIFYTSLFFSISLIHRLK